MTKWMIELLHICINNYNNDHSTSVIFLTNVKFYFWVDKLKTKMLIMYCKQIKYLPNTHISATSGQNKKNNYHHTENTKHGKIKYEKHLLNFFPFQLFFQIHIIAHFSQEHTRHSIWSATASYDKWNSFANFCEHFATANLFGQKLNYTSQLTFVEKLGKLGKLGKHEDAQQWQQIMQFECSLISHFRHLSHSLHIGHTFYLNFNKSLLYFICRSNETNLKSPEFKHNCVLHLCHK